MASTATARDTLCAFCEQKMSGLITTGKHSGKAWVAGRNVKIWETANTCPICHAISKSFLTTEDQASKNSVQIEVRDDRLRQSNAEPLPLIEFDIIAKELRGKALRILLVKEGNDIPASIDRAILSESHLSLENRLPLIQQWIKECSPHPECNFSAPELPKRLLYISSASVKLVETEDIPQRPVYTTLSYCWGPPTSSPPYKTTKDNLNEHLQTIPLERLQRTYKDAIQVTLALGLQYIWIDALCIIQSTDDFSDWQLESAKMASIYQGSFITIAAASSSDSDGGLFLKRVNTGLFATPKNDPSATSCLIRSNQYQLGIHELASLERLSDSPTSVRAWILQEVVLATRVIHFSQDQIFWQCRRRFKSEDGCVDNLPNVRISQRLLTSFSSESPLQSWRNLISDYMRRQLTNTRDRLAAIAGLTHHYRTQLATTDMLGVWESSLSHDLAWGRHHPLTVSRSHSIPSWSWLSIAQPPQGEFNIFHFGSPGDWKSTPKLQLDHWNIHWSGKPLTSTLLSSELRVSGFYTTRKITHEAWVTDERHSWLNMSETSSFVLRDTDETSNIVGDFEVTLLLLYTQGSEYFLVLVEDSKIPLTYRRIGVGWAARKTKNRDGPLLFGDAESKQITLV